MKVDFLLTKLRLRCNGKLIYRDNTNDARIAGTTIHHMIELQKVNKACLFVTEPFLQIQI